MGKKRRYEEVEENGETTFNDSAAFESPKRHKKSKRARLEETAVEEAFEAQPEDEYELWLVRKPVDVPIEDLAELKFPRKYKTRMVTFNSALGEQDEHGNILELDCEFEKAEKDILHVPLSQANSAKDLKKLKPVGIIGGVALVSRRTTLMDQAPIKPEENFLEPDEPNNEVEPMPFKIKSIRRKPKLKLVGLKERLTAFGCPRSD